MLRDIGDTVLSLKLLYCDEKVVSLQDCQRDLHLYSFFKLEEECFGDV